MCSPSEVAEWEKKESEKLPKIKKHQETLSFESQKWKWKEKKRWMRITTYPQLLVFGRNPFDFW